MFLEVLNQISRNEETISRKNYYGELFHHDTLGPHGPSSVLLWIDGLRPMLVTSC